MTILYIVSTLLFAAAIVFLLGLTPEGVADDFSRILTPEQSLWDMAKIAQGKKKSKKLSREFAGIREALEAIGKKEQLATASAASLILFAVGVVLSLFIGNALLMPVIAGIMAVIPFLRVKSSLAYYQKHVNEGIETALSIISTAYVRSDNIVGAVSENIDYLKPPVKDIFSRFVMETTSINSDIKTALRRLRERINNQIFGEWCDCLIQCQDDRNMKMSLMPIVNKLTDVRIVNNELQTMLAEPKKEYWMMVLMVVANIPLLYILNRDWFHALIYTLPGKIVLAVCGVVIAVTSVSMMKYTRPLAYQR